MITVMDLTVLNLALPRLSAALAPSGTQLLWIIDIYGFVLAGMSLLSLTVAIEKWLSLRRTAKESARFLIAWRKALAE